MLGVFFGAACAYTIYLLDLGHPAARPHSGHHGPDGRVTPRGVAAACPPAFSGSRAWA